MILTAFDVESLSRSLSHWELGEYISEALVIIACAGELVADLEASWLTEERKKHIQRRSTILLVAALAASLVCLVRTNELSGNVIGSLGDKAKTAGIKAQSAIDKSSLAENKAGDAIASAEGATGASSRAQGVADAARLAAGKAQTVAGVVTNKAEELNQQLVATKTKLDTVEARRAELEKSLINLAVCNAPRVISNWFLLGTGGGAINNTGMAIPDSSKSYVDSLRPMAGQIVLIEVVPDAEARRAALNIARTLADAQWSVQTPLKFVDELKDGVSVQPSVFTGLAKGEMPNMPLYWHASDVADRLLEFLHSYNWQAARGWPLDPQGKLIRDEKVLPAGAIRIQVGLYPPAVYVSPPGQKEFASRVEEMKREREKLMAESRHKREEALPPDLRTTLKQKNEEWEARIKRETSQGPCQVLNPLY